MAALSSTIGPVFDNNVKEKAWAAFLTHLMPWELHRLTIGDQELILHDLWIEGEISLTEARLTLSFEEE